MVTVQLLQRRIIMEYIYHLTKSYPVSLYARRTYRAFVDRETVDHHIQRPSHTRRFVNFMC